MANDGSGLTPRRRRRSSAGRGAGPTPEPATERERAAGGPPTARVESSGVQIALDPRRVLWRDSAMILVFVLIGLLAAQTFLPAGGGQPIDTPLPSGIVTGSLPPGATLPPGVTFGPIVNPSLGIDATPTPIPVITLGPSPSPSPKPTPKPTPRPTAKPTPKPPSPGPTTPSTAAPTAAPTAATTTSPSAAPTITPAPSPAPATIAPTGTGP